VKHAILVVEVVQGWKASGASKVKFLERSDQLQEQEKAFYEDQVEVSCVSRS